MFSPPIRGEISRFSFVPQRHHRINLEDVFINLIEVAKENWSFGNGEAQYAT
jgi:hypothetical protein